MRIGALTMVRAGARRVATPVVQKTIARVAPTIQPHTTARHLTPQTPKLPQLAPGTISLLDSRAGAGQVPERTYEQIDSAPTSSAAVPSSVTITTKEEKSTGIFPLALAALAAYFMG